MKIHREGTATILISLLLLAACTAFLLWTEGWLQWLGAVLTLGALVLFGLILWFFRLPKRQSEDIPGQILCPADGTVVVVERTREPEYFGDERIQVSVFMSPLNVHAQWYPFRGKIRYTRYHKGKYLVAWHPKSSELNERSTVVLEDDSGRQILVRQIAGAVASEVDTIDPTITVRPSRFASAIMARRIVTYARPDNPCGVNEELGFIKFGSRVDIFLPADAEILVKPGDKVTGNQTVLALFA